MNSFRRHLPLSSQCLEQRRSIRLQSGLHIQSHRRNDADAPRRGPQQRRLGIALQPYVDEDVGEAARSVSQRQRVQDARRNASLVGGDNGRCVEAERLEAVLGGRRCAQEALLALWSLALAIVPAPTMMPGSFGRRTFWSTASLLFRLSL